MFDAESNTLQKLSDMPEEDKADIIQDVFKNIPYDLVKDASAEQLFRVALSLVGLTPDMPLIEIGTYDAEGHFKLI